MIFLRRSSGGCRLNFRLFRPVVALVLFGAPFAIAQAGSKDYLVELRLSPESTLQLLDNAGKVHHNLPLGSVRKRVAIKDVILLASFGEDRQHHSLIMLGMDISANQSVAFLLGKNIIVATPESILTFQFSPDRSYALITPSLMGKISINGSVLSRGEIRKLRTSSADNAEPTEIISPPSQPKPNVRDFESIPDPSSR